MLLFQCGGLKMASIGGSGFFPKVEKTKLTSIFWSAGLVYGVECWEEI